MPTRRSRADKARKSSPSSRTSPASGASSPAMARSNVVLPEPEGPSRARNSPGSARRETPFRAGKRPKRFSIPRACRPASDLGSGARWAAEFAGEAPFEEALEDERDEGEAGEERGDREG